MRPLIAATLLLAGCPAPPPSVSDLGGPIDAAAGDRATGGCPSPCVGATPVCNAKGRCVGCETDGDCAMGDYCKVVSDALATCVPGCAADAACPKGQRCCAHACVDPSSDAANCGGCGMACGGPHATAACAAGACGALACDDGWGDCDGDAKNGCEANLHADPANCTACGMACALANAFAGCADGCYATACKFGFAHCTNNPDDGCETAVAADPANCGACGKVCPAAANGQAGCSAGACGVAFCAVGWADCDGNGANGCETKVATDGKNCGACGNACPMGDTCVGGLCNCATCNLAHASAQCVNMSCSLDKCAAGFADCNANPADGCEVDTTRDAANCGALIAAPTRSRDRSDPFPKSE